MRIIFFIAILASHYLGFSGPNNDSLLLEKVIDSYGDAKYDSPDFVKVEILRLSELESIKSSAFFTSKCYSILGEVYRVLSNIDSANYYFRQALEIREANGYLVHAASTHEYMSRMFSGLGQDSIALHHLYHSLRIKESLGNKEYLKSLYTSLGNLHLSLEEYDSSYYYHNKALNIYLEQNDTIGIATSFNNIGNIYYWKDDLKVAINYYFKAFYYFELQAADGQSIPPLIDIGVCYYELGESDSALYFYNQARLKSELSGNTESLDYIYLSIAEAYVQKNQPDSAVVMFQRYIAFSDSIFTTDNAKTILEADKKYQTKEKEQLLVLEQEKSETLAAKDANKRKTIYVLLALFVIIGLVVLYLVRNARQKLKLNSLEISIKNQEIDNLLKNQEAKSYAALLEGQNAERERIAQDLHDQLGGTLAAVKVHFSLMDQKIVELQSENRDLFDKVNEMLGNAVQDVRRISHDLASGYLSKLGLRGALIDLTNVLTSAKKLKVDFFMDENLPKFDPKKEQDIYSIIQELVSNTLKHANATTVDLQLNRQGETCNIMFEDNGVGFDPIKADFKGIGLKSLSNRINKLGGKLTIDSFVGRGTITIIEIPL